MGAARSRSLLQVAFLVTALVIGVSQWIDLAALLHRPAGPLGRYLVSEHADWVTWGTECLSGAAVLIAVARSVRLMGRLARGDAFGSGVSGDLRSFAFWILLSTVSSILLPLVLPGLIAAIWTVHVHVDDEIGGSDMLLLLVSAILYQVARLLDAAQRLADDHQQIV